MFPSVPCAEDGAGCFGTLAGLVGLAMVCTLVVGCFAMALCCMRTNDEQWVDTEKVTAGEDTGVAGTNVGGD